MEFIYLYYMNIVYNFTLRVYSKFASVLYLNYVDIIIYIDCVYVIYVPIIQVVSMDFDVWTSLFNSLRTLPSRNRGQCMHWSTYCVWPNVCTIPSDSGLKVDSFPCKINNESIGGVVVPHICTCIHFILNLQRRILMNIHFNSKLMSKTVRLRRNGRKRHCQWI